MSSAAGSFVRNIESIIRRIIDPYVPAFEQATVTSVVGSPNRSVTVQRVGAASPDTAYARILGSYIPKVGDVVLCARAGVGVLVVLGQIASQCVDRYFVSAEQTGIGTEQNITHGLGVTPRFVFGAFTGGTTVTSMVEGAHDATNVKITVTSGAKFRILAFV